MSTTVEQLKADFEAFLAEDAKFTAGNGAAGTRARKALQEVAKGVKARRKQASAEPAQAAARVPRAARPRAAAASQPAVAAPPR